eukprot:TRINITY_DN28326_c0_g1_i2.p2 TRINITY_DN28326_c0_g1~~TRINITY_DN28326_c0_g1_i2.p2  ORF type:complete len:128 (+),score=1.10 TRINITY_DN28326_c0_g1_i2:654-1037(+)
MMYLLLIYSFRFLDFYSLLVSIKLLSIKNNCITNIFKKLIKLVLIKFNCSIVIDMQLQNFDRVFLKFWWNYATQREEVFKLQAVEQLKLLFCGILILQNLHLIYYLLLLVKIIQCMCIILDGDENER